jgi:hypothetical protein
MLYQHKINKRIAHHIRECILTDDDYQWPAACDDAITKSTTEQLKSIMILTGCDLPLALECIEGTMFNNGRFDEYQKLLEWAYDDYHMLGNQLKLKLEGAAQ